MLYKNMYKGNRYQPAIDGVWNKNKPYESLTVVLWKGNSYTSKKYVPIGVDIENELYWAITGNYNQQIENYRREVKKYSKEVQDYKNEVCNKIDKKDIVNNFENGLQTNVLSGALGKKLNNSIIELSSNITNLNNQIINLNNAICSIHNYPKQDGDKSDYERIVRCLKDNNKVYLPSGEYVINGDIELKSNMQIIGDKGGTIISTNSNLFTISTPVEEWKWENVVQNVIVSGLIINSESTHNPLNLIKIFRSVFTDIIVNGSNIGLWLGCGWSNIFINVSLLSGNIGVMLGNPIYENTKYKSYICNANIFINVRCEYNNTNIKLGYDNFNGSQIGSGNNFLGCTIQFARENEVVINSYDNTNFDKCYFECSDANEESIFKLGYVIPSLENEVSEEHSYLMATGVNVENCIIVGSNELGVIEMCKTKHAKNVSFNNNTFMTWANVVDNSVISNKTLCNQERVYKPVKWNNNNYILAYPNIIGKFISDEVFKNKPSYKNEWFNGGTTNDEQVEYQLVNGVVRFSGIIANENFNGESVMFTLPEQLRPNHKIMMSIPTIVRGNYISTNLFVEILPNGDIKVTGENGKVMIPLTSINYYIGG